MLKASEKLAGENGAGKTTLAKLLARVYDPTEGRIKFDGRDLRNTTSTICAGASAFSRIPLLD